MRWMCLKYQNPKYLNVLFSTLLWVYFTLRKSSELPINLVKNGFIAWWSWVSYLFLRVMWFTITFLFPNYWPHSNEGVLSHWQVSDQACLVFVGGWSLGFRRSYKFWLKYCCLLGLIQQHLAPFLLKVCARILNKITRHALARYKDISH